MAVSTVLQNRKNAHKLREVALLLDTKAIRVLVIQADRTAAEKLKRLDIPVSRIIEQQSMDGLKDLPGIGVSLARSIHTLAVTGRLPMLDRLRGNMDPVGLLMLVPGLGLALSYRLHDDLPIETLEQIEMAVHDGQLACIEGVDPKKPQDIIDALTARSLAAHLSSAAGFSSIHRPIFKQRSGLSTQEDPRLGHPLLR